jgi:phage-related tail protein
LDEVIALRAKVSELEQQRDALKRENAQLRRDVEIANSIKTAEKKILISEIEQHTATKSALSISEARVKELEKQAELDAAEWAISRGRVAELQARIEEDKAYYKMKHDELVSENRSVVDLRRLLDDSNGLVHQLRSMLREAGFPDRVKWGEDLHGNEEFAQVRIECQMKDALAQLAQAKNELEEANRTSAHWEQQTQSWNKMAVELGCLAGVSDDEVPWFDKARAAVNAMRAQIRTLTTSQPSNASDKERLDWLEKPHAFYPTGFLAGQSVRQRIDAARLADKGTEGKA